MLLPENTLTITKNNMNLLSMKNTIKIFTFSLFVTLSVTLKAQFVIPPTLPSVVAPAFQFGSNSKRNFQKN
jgi:hypothetical protein